MHARDLTKTKLLNFEKSKLPDDVRLADLFVNHSWYWRSHKQSLSHFGIISFSSAETELSTWHSMKTKFIELDRRVTRSVSFCSREKWWLVLYRSQTEREREEKVKITTSYPSFDIAYAQLLNVELDGDRNVVNETCRFTGSTAVDDRRWSVEQRLAFSQVVCHLDVNKWTGTIIRGWAGCTRYGWRAGERQQRTSGWRRCDERIVFDLIETQIGEMSFQVGFRGWRFRWIEDHRMPCGCIFALAKGIRRGGRSRIGGDFLQDWLVLVRQRPTHEWRATNERRGHTATVVQKTFRWRRWQVSRVIVAVIGMRQMALERCRWDFVFMLIRSNLRRECLIGRTRTNSRTCTLTQC